MKKIIGNIIFIIYAIIAVFVTICLLSYNEFKVTEFGETSLVLIDNEELQPNYNKGDLVIVNRDTRIRENDSIFFYNTSADKGLQNAARVAFIDEGNVADVGDSTGAQALKGGTTSIIWEPNYDVHTAAGVANAKEIYGLDTTTTGASQLSYQGIKAEFADSEGVTLKNTNTFSQYFQTVTPTISTVKDFDAQQTLLNLKAGITKVRIYMWVEGQDVDCENNASGTDISFNVQITKATE